MDDKIKSLGNSTAELNINLKNHSSCCISEVKQGYT